MINCYLWVLELETSPLFMLLKTFLLFLNVYRKYVLLYFSEEINEWGQMQLYFLNTQISQKQAQFLYHKETKQKMARWQSMLTHFHSQSPVMKTTLDRICCSPRELGHGYGFSFPTCKRTQIKWHLDEKQQHRFLYVEEFQSEVNHKT